jgi:transcription initiation factor TFIIF subunit beta
MLFALFAEKPSWSFKELRSRTEQPAEYLKEVLTMIAFLHRSGELNGQYTLLDNYRDQESQDSVCAIYVQIQQILIKPINGR